MHIPDGFLSTPVWMTCAAVSGATVAVSCVRANKRMEERHVPLFGVSGAFVFAAQMLNFPIPGGTSGHFVGSALVGILLGPAAAVIVLTSVLVIQCLVFGDGGLTALGANVLNMGVTGGLVGAGLSALARGMPRKKSFPDKAVPLSEAAPVVVTRRGLLVLTGFFAGWLSVVIGAVACGLELVFSPQQGTNAVGWGVVATMGLVHAVIGVGEGIITAAALGLVAAVRPDLLELERI